MVYKHIYRKSSEVKTSLTADVSYMTSYLCSSDHQETWSHLVSESLMDGEKNERPENVICCGTKTHADPKLLSLGPQPKQQRLLLEAQRVEEKRPGSWQLLWHSQSVGYWTPCFYYKKNA